MQSWYELPLYEHPPSPGQAPDVYIEALRRLGAPPPPAAPRALVIEDAIHGLSAARTAGAAAVAVATSLPAEALAPHADLVVGGLGDLVRRLAALRVAGDSSGRVVFGPPAPAEPEAGAAAAAVAGAMAAAAVS
mgnify:CR=1 FL=1